jgi:NtrC-family two-component system sensor histidine kinase KinB
LGNYDVEVSLNSPDELGSVTEEFNSMAKRLKAFHNLNVEQIMAEKRKSESVIRSIDAGIILIDAECTHYHRRSKRGFQSTDKDR